MLGGVLAAGVAGTLLAGCSTSSGPDAATRAAQQLVPLARAAADDAVAARDLAARTPDRAAALRVVADERTVHAQALTDEIARLSGDLAAEVSASPTPSGTAPSGTTAQPVASSVDQLRSRLAGARTDTTTAAVSADGYRAGLLGSIAASLAALVEVQLG
ncbi:hypothetical protein GCM10009722_33450 [Williamsia deligens]|nr:hypothetical protein [Williamsia deligens]